MSYPRICFAWDSRSKSNFVWFIIQQITPNNHTPLQCLNKNSLEKCSTAAKAIHSNATNPLLICSTVHSSSISVHMIWYPSLYSWKRFHAEVTTCNTLRLKVKLHCAYTPCKAMAYLTFIKHCKSYGPFTSSSINHTNSRFQFLCTYISSIQWQ